MPIFLQTPKKQGVLQKSSFHPVSGNQAGHPKVLAKGRIPKRRFQEIHFLCRRLLFFAERHGFHIPPRAVQGMRNNIHPLRGIHLQVQFAFVFPYVTPHCTISYLSLISFNFVPIAEMTGTLTALPAILYSRPSERPVAAAL